MLGIICVLTRRDALQSNESNERGWRVSDKIGESGCGFYIFKYWSRRSENDASAGQIEKYGCISAGCSSCASARLPFWRRRKPPGTWPRGNARVLAPSVGVYMRAFC